MLRSAPGFPLIPRCVGVVVFFGLNFSGRLSSWSEELYYTGYYDDAFTSVFVFFWGLSILPKKSRPDCTQANAFEVMFPGEMLSPSR